LAFSSARALPAGRNRTLRRGRNWAWVTASVRQIRG
jgi:hypothetical protein